MISLILCLVFMLNFYESLSSKIQEIVSYLFFGVCTTLVSIISYFFLRIAISNYMVCTVISWILAVIFAYVTNKLFVFHSENKNIIKEIIEFFSSRILTLFIELALMYVMVDLLSISDGISKIGVQFIVIVTNYILSKLIVFKGKV